MMTEDQERKAVIAAAMDWLDTPYHHAARVRKAGVDCANFLIAAFEQSGVEAPFTIPSYMPDWYVHRNDELLIDIVMQRGVEIEQKQAKPADVVVYRFGRCYSHGAIILEWPRIIHAFRQVGRVIIDVADQGHLANRQRRFFTRKTWGG